MNPDPKKLGKNGRGSIFSPVNHCRVGMFNSYLMMIFMVKKALLLGKQPRILSQDFRKKHGVFFSGTRPLQSRRFSPRHGPRKIIFFRREPRPIDEVPAVPVGEFFRRSVFKMKNDLSNNSNFSKGGIDRSGVFFCVFTNFLGLFGTWTIFSPKFPLDQMS